MSCEFSKNILIIDDEAGMRDMVSRLFADAGYDTATAPDGAAGLATAKSGEFDLVVLDMSLPKMSGLEVLAGIKEVKPDLPVIMVTAYGSTQTAIEALRLGAYDYITKPFDLDELQMTAERALEAQRVIDENRFLRGELKKKFGFDNIIGGNPNVQRAYVMAAQVAPITGIPATASLRDVEKIHIERVLKAKHWNQSGAAQALGIDRKTLRNKIREFHLDRDGDGA
jgi:DNA-binding NtrC family response regulator